MKQLHDLADSWARTADCLERSPERETWMPEIAIYRMCILQLRRELARMEKEKQP